MENMSLKIAGLTIGIYGDSLLGEFNGFGEFSVNGTHLPDLAVYLNPVVSVRKPQGKICLDDCNKWILDESGNNTTTIYQCSRRDPENELIFKIEVSSNWQHASITFLKDNKNVEKEVAGIIGYILLRNKLLFHQGLIIHASALMWEGKGLMFTAPSGTGKSTQAELWRKHKNAAVLNDDSPVIRCINEQVVVFGTPWSGSKTIHRNADAPLAAIIVLEQSDITSIRRLTVSESIPKLLPRCLLPYHDPALMDIAIGILERITKIVPVFNLKCGLDEGTVEVVAQCIK
jgi:hypothetical protein